MRKKVLVIEDDHGHIELIKRVLLRRGKDLDVEIVENLNNAAKAIKKNAPNIILTDYRLPDGYSNEFALNYYKDFPIVIMTSFGNESTAVDSIKNGAMNYIIKSNEMFDSLPDILKKALDDWQKKIDEKSATEKIEQELVSFRTILSATPTGMILFNENEEVVFINETAKEMFKCNNDDVGKRCGDILSCINRKNDKRGCGFSKKCDDCLLYASIKKSLGGQQGSVEGVASFHLDEKENDVWLKYRMKYLTINSQNYIIVSIEDVTEYKRAELNIVNYRNKLENILESLTYPFMEIDPDTYCITLANSFAKEAYKINKSSKCYEVSHGFSAPCGSKEHPCPLEEVKKTKKPVIVEHTHYDKDGQAHIVEIHAYPVFGVDSLLTGVIEYSFDITERKIAERKLKESREQYMLAVNGVNDGIWDWDIKNDSLYLSPKWKEMLGYNDSELENNFDTFARLLHPEDKERVMDNVQQYLKGNKKYYLIDFRYMHKNGEYRWIMARGEALRDDDGIPYRMAGSHTDITDRKENEIHIKKAKDEAELANRVKSDFIANMSHEIRTPLNGIIGFIDILMETNLDQLQKEYMDNVKSSGIVLLSLLNDILDLSKIEAGKLELDETKTDFFELIENAIDIIKYSSSNKGIELLLNVESDIPRFIYADSLRLKQVLMNLLTNAVKFTDNGEVELVVNKISTSNQDVTLKVQVRDTGIGIAPGKLENLFDAFYQADASITRKYGGTGLGLVISNSILEKMNSKIEVESAPGEGSTFSFVLKLKYIKGEKTEYKSIDAVKSVLIVDDNKHSRTILKNMCENKSIKCETAVDAMDALTKIKMEKTYDAIITDYNMPGMNGVELIKNIRKILKMDYSKQKLILLYSSCDDKEIFLKSKDLNISCKIAKPVKMGVLYDCLSRLYIKEAEGDDLWHKNESIAETKEDKEEIFATNKRVVKVLIAEDNRVNMILARTLVYKVFVDVEVFEAKNGEEAVEKYKQHNPDFVLMDVQMPHKDGITATVEIRDYENGLELKRVPIIAVTAGNLKNDKQRCLSAGMDDFILKPFEKKDLKSITDKYVVSTNKKNKNGDPKEKSKDRDSLPRFDKEKFFERMEGDENWFEGIKEIFKNELKEEYELLKKRYVSGGVEEMKKSAHRFKGFALNMHFEKLADLTLSVEKLEKESASDYDYLMILVEKEVEKLCELLN